MKVQTRLSLLSSALWGIVFIVVSILIFSLYKQNIEKSVYHNLEKTAQIIAFYFFEEDEISFKEYEKIKKQYENLSNAYFQVYDKNNHLEFGLKTPQIPVEIIDEIRNKGKLTFNIPGFLCYGVYYKDNQGDFVIITKDKKDEVVTNYIKPLWWILTSAFMVGMLATILLNLWISRLAYRPIRETIKQVKNMSPNSLSLLKSSKIKDEIYDLTDTFNQLLQRISDTFKIQQNFVSYVSHEFKTPLAAIQGNLEVFSLKDRTPEEYRELSDLLIEEIRQLEEILDILLIVSDLRKNTDIAEVIHLDVLIEEIIRKVCEKYPSASQQISWKKIINDEFKDYQQINIDRTQLFMALYNLIENAVKFSQENPVEIVLYWDNALYLSIKDHGIGIPEEHMGNIIRPFFRGKNAQNIPGKGIGLSIALRILEKNKVKYQINSKENEGTEFLLRFT
ncbi:HAMP domain-containing histidine kinase [Apibacter muscae]|uniref:histidine kinase n=1 Tax=Apibacter muscae TaxID=2509004 RepID=A0A563DFI6_9FLAO|nr:HAMP domain-containing sensor histidine kinase [Apibacter muscae]TWP28960.1 HAMP domain-containing histidine kinase [Apibacter muscae]